MTSRQVEKCYSKEYLDVRRLISLLTNDDSDKLIVDKLKGKNLLSLLYEAKIADASKDADVSRRVLGCVLRAIEREKLFDQGDDLQLSWTKKLLLSLNCLSPAISDSNEERLVSDPKRAALRPVKSSLHGKLRFLKLKQRASSKLYVCKRRQKSIRRSNEVCKQNVELCNAIQYSCSRRQVNWLVPVRCFLKKERMSHESVCPLNLSEVQYVTYVRCQQSEESETNLLAGKRTLSTQTVYFDQDDQLKSQAPIHNIRLQDVLDAAGDRENSRQREYVKAFISNIEPPFDLSSGFPPYLKLPMTSADDVATNYSSSVTSIAEDIPLVRRDIDNTKYLPNCKKEDAVKRFVEDLTSHTWSEASESIVSGVINEPLPYGRVDYSQLGTCILKKLGAYPICGLEDKKFDGKNPVVPEIVLSCSEWFESGGDGRTPQLKSPTEEMIDEKNTATDDDSTSIVEVKLVNDDTGVCEIWETNRKVPSKVQNYCFYEPESVCSGLQMDTFSLSESSNEGDGMRAIQRGNAVLKVDCQEESETVFREIEKLDEKLSSPSYWWRRDLNLASDVREADELVGSFQRGNKNRLPRPQIVEPPFDDVSQKPTVGTLCSETPAVEIRPHSPVDSSDAFPATVFTAAHATTRLDKVTDPNCKLACDNKHGRKKSKKSRKCKQHSIDVSADRKRRCAIM